MIRRALRWWWNELLKPFRSDTSVPTGLKNDPDTFKDWSSEPVEPKVNKVNLADLPMYGQTKQAEPTDRDLLSDDEKELFEQISPAAPEKVIAYPPKADDQDARDWVTEELQRRTGGLTRHPLDMTKYPEPPTEADLAAQEMFRPGARAFFSHGYSMRYLGELLSRAKRKDRSLSTEDLMALRSRGLI